MRFWFWGVLALGGCQSIDDRLNAWRHGTPSRSAPAIETVQAPPTADSQRVLLVINTSSSASQEIGAYYRAKRGIPKDNVLLVTLPESEEISRDAYQKLLENPVRSAIKGLRSRVDFIVLTKGVPIRLDNGGGNSVDATLMAMESSVPPIAQVSEAGLKNGRNPYFDVREPFNSAKFKLYLTTRLDGYTVADCKRLVDQSLAAKPDRGLFFFDEAENRKSGGYLETQSGLSRAHKLLTAKGFDSLLDTMPAFVAPSAPLMGYSSWGSNDGAFDAAKYKSLRWKPGALAETFVSTSGRTFNPTTGGQSLISDLIAGGVTGVKGYVSEPYTFALALPDLLFDRYTAGLNLAESFYGASRFIKWKDVVIGDPLCAPYKK